MWQRNIFHVCYHNMFGAWRIANSWHVYWALAVWWRLIGAWWVFLRHGWCGKAFLGIFSLIILKFLIVVEILNFTAISKENLFMINCNLFFKTQECFFFFSKLFYQEYGATRSTHVLHMNCIMVLTTCVNLSYLLYIVHNFWFVFFYLHPITPTCCIFFSILNCKLYFPFKNMGDF